MPVINGVYLKDFTALPGSVADANIIPIAITGDNIAYRTTVAGIVTDARITAKLLTGLSVTGGAVVAADTILAAFGKVQNQINGKQGTVTLTTTGTSGAATFVSNTLNIPNYGSALTGYVPYTGATQDVDLGAFKLNAQSFHVKGTAGNGHLGLKHQSSAATASANESSLFADSNGDMSFQNANLYLNKFVTSANSANRTYTFPDATGTVALVGGSGVGTVTSVAAITLGTTGTDLSSTVSNGTTTPVITLQVPTASATNRGALSSADWSTFNGKQGTITLTTTGTSGAATFVANTLNIPNYADGGVLSLSAIGATANANAATITGTVLNLQPADASFGGVVTTGTQTFAGDKTLTGTLYGIGLSMTGTTADIVQGTATSGKALRGTATTGWGLYASATTGVGVQGNSSGTGGSGVFGSSVDGYGGVFYNDSTTYAALEVNNNNESAGNIAVFRKAGTSVFIINSSGNISNGTYTYTLPSATGTLALTSALSSYLPLTGGTLTGALSGTSASFSSTNTATSFIPSGSTVPTNGMYLSAANTLNFATNTTNRLSIASTGAATFSGNLSCSGASIQLNQTELISSTGASNRAYAFNLGNVAAGDFSISQGSSATGGTYTTRLTINPTGYVGIGTTSPARIIHTYGTGAGAEWILEDSASSANVKKFNVLVSSGTTQFRALNDANNGGTVWLNVNNSTGAATFSSSVTATSFFESSSIKGKDIIKTNPLTNLNLDVIQYTRKTDESKDVRYGYSAEQIHSLMPELTDKDVTAVKYLDVHTLLIAQLQQEIKELKAKLN